MRAADAVEGGDVDWLEARTCRSQDWGNRRDYRGRPGQRMPPGRGYRRRGTGECLCEPGSAAGVLLSVLRAQILPAVLRGRLREVVRRCLRLADAFARL